MIISNFSSAPMNTGPRTIVRPNLPTIKSESVVDSPTTLGIHGEEGVPLPVEDSVPKSPVAISKASPVKADSKDLE
jgi:hypothetical protein